ncbi:MAG: MBL fold metallo-hydrolase, partial [Candidatus Bathyarchaeota archaeon]|nr:MBL fold metallo-hydrolase [Candidatus Bathyarchaeota archaeon]
MNQKTAIILTLLIVFCFVPVAKTQTGTLVTVHFIDVGQGDSIFIDTANKDVLIDAGSASASQTVLDYLADLNITHIDYVVATHAHEDHIGGLVDVLDSFLTIDEVLVNNHTRTTQVYQNFITNAQRYNVTVAERGQVITLTETASMTVLNPVQPLEFSDPNDNSIVLKLQ